MSIIFNNNIKKIKLYKNNFKNKKILKKLLLKFKDFLNVI